MSAVRHFESFRFFVQSATDPETEWLVDLSEQEGRGECGCSSKWKRQPRSPCWHIDAAAKALKEMQK